MEPITLACVTVPRFNSLKRLLDRCLPSIDQALIVTGQGDSQSAEYLRSLSPKVVELYRSWDDSFARQYQVYLDYLRKINYQGWVLICDDDELPSEDLLKVLPLLVEESKLGTRFSCVEFRCNPIDPVTEFNSGPSNYYRQIFYRYQPGMRYTIDLHQALAGYQNSRLLRRNEVYYHIKSRVAEVEGACRNYFIGGIWVPNRSTPMKDQSWNELQLIIKAHYPSVKVFADLKEVFKHGNIHQELKNWILKYKDAVPAGMGELKQYATYYFEILHPEEA